MSGSVPCPECGSAIPAGRLACPSCGTLLAAVRAQPGDRDAALDPDGAWLRDLGADTAGEPRDDDEEAERIDPDLLAMTGASTGAPAPPTPSAGARPATTPADAVREPPVDEDAAADGLSSGGIVPGAYLPPSTVHRPALPAADGGYVPPPSPPPSIPPTPAPAATWAGSSAPSIGSPGAAAPFATGPAATLPASGLGRDAAPATPGKASILADLPFDAPDELEGWLVALGSGSAILGFFLPWHAALDVGLAGYFGSWGLGIAANLPMFTLAIVILALAVLPNRVAVWVRTGVLGMVGGGMLFGLVWLYIGGGTEIGAIFAAVGAILLIFGGVLAVSPGRAARRDQGEM